MSQTQVVLSEAKTVSQAAAQLADSQPPDEISVSPRGDGSTTPQPSSTPVLGTGQGHVLGSVQKHSDEPVVD